MGFRVHRVYRGRNKFDFVIFTTVHYILGQCYFVGARLQFFQCPLLMMKLLGQNAKAIHLYHLFKLSYFHDIIRYKWRHMLFSACTDFRPTAHVNNILPQCYVILWMFWFVFVVFVPYKMYWVVHSKLRISFKGINCWFSFFCLLKRLKQLYYIFQTQERVFLFPKELARNKWN